MPHNSLVLEMTNSLKKFRIDHIEPNMEKDDEAGFFRPEVYRGLGELGITGIITPEEFGGLGLNFTTLSQALIELAKSSVAMAVTVSVSSMAQAAIVQFGNAIQKKKYLPKLATGEEIGAFCLSESHAGSDAGALTTKAHKCSGGYHITGRKMWITSAGIAKTYIVMARTSDLADEKISAFIVRDGTEGLSFGKKEKKMGWKTSPTREVIFDKVFVPDEDILGSPGIGLKIALSSLNKGRFTIGAIGVGCAKRSFDEAVSYALTRQQFNESIFDFQGLQFLIAELALEIESAELLVLKAAMDFDANKLTMLTSCMAKLKATDVAMKVTTEAVQILGGVGVTTEYPVERFMRDAKILQIVEGTNQIQKVVMGRELKKLYTAGLSI